MEEKNELIRLVYQSGPVTALKLIEDLVFAGITNSLHIYELKTKQRIQVLQVLPNQNLHGISKVNFAESSEKLFCVFGEKTFQILELDLQQKRVFKRNKPLEMKDWIWDIKWLKSNSKSTSHYDCLALVTAHNSIIQINWQTNQILNTIQCKEQCILYCGHFIGSQWDRLVLAAGTVFNEVILWAPTLGLIKEKGGGSIVSQPFHRLTGHQGVIFSIHYHEEQKKICSASDDRSIRVWKLQLATNSKEEEQLYDWQNLKSECILVLFGHQARVWRAFLMTNGLASIGEDASCCIWDKEGKIKQKFKGHKGKSIWSLAINKEENLIVTGGGDSSIRVWSIDCDFQNQKLTSKSLQINHLESKIETDLNFPRSLTHLDFNTALIMTNNGTLYQYCLIHSIWASVMKEPTFASYSSLSSSSKSNSFAVGNLYGTIKLFQPSFPSSSESKPDADCCLCRCQFLNCILDKFYSGKIYNLFWIEDNKDEFLFTTGPEGIMTLSLLHSKNTFLNLEQLHIGVLPPSKQRWATCGCILRNSKSNEINGFICGDRNGSIHFYRIQRDLKNKKSDPVQSFYRIHGKAGVTDVRLHNGYIFTSGRDGHYKQFELTENNELQLLNSKKVFKGFEWIDRLLFDEKKGFLILGFHSSNFIVWSCEKSQKLLEISCGGGHRDWSCRLKEDVARFIYIKARDVVFCEAKIPSNQKILKPSHHGRQQTDIKHIFSRKDSQGRQLHVCATCSDDTTVQIIELFYDDCNEMEMRIIQVLPSHISSVQTLFCLKTLTDSCGEEGGPNYLLFSAGGRAQLNCSRLTFLIPDDDGETVCVPAQLCTEFLVKRLPKSWKAKNMTFDPETRILALTAFYGQNIHPEIPKNIIFLGMSCSDGSVRLFSFDEEIPEVQPVWQSIPSECCVLQITHLIHYLTENHETKSLIPSSSLSSSLFSSTLSSPFSFLFPCQVFLLSAATDGLVSFWDVTSFCRLFVLTHSKKDFMRKAERKSKSNTTFLGGRFKKGWEPEEEEGGGGGEGREKERREGEGRDLEEGGEGRGGEEEMEEGRGEKKGKEEEGREFGEGERREEEIGRKKEEKEFEEERRKGEGEEKERKEEEGGRLEEEESEEGKETEEKEGKKEEESEEKETKERKKEEERKILPKSQIFSSKQKPFFQIRTNSSGINSLHLKKFQENKYFLSTGGDDNAFFVTSFSISDDVSSSTQNDQQKVTCFFERKKHFGHAAQITGIKILNEELILTSSIDQRICIWKIPNLDSEIEKEKEEEEKEEKEIIFIASQYLEVADLSNLDVWVEDEQLFIAVCGSGLGILTVHLSLLQKETTQKKMLNA